MKKVFYLTLIAFVFVSCSKKKNNEPAPLQNTKVLIRSYQEVILPGGIKDTVAMQNNIFHAWKATGRDFEITESSSAIPGVAHDKISDEYVKSDHKSSGRTLEFSAQKGKYFVCVVVADEDGLGSYSYRTFDVDGETGIVIDKVFPDFIPFAKRLDW